MSSCAKTVKKELVRAVLERARSMAAEKAPPAAIDGEKRTFDDIQETLNLPYINGGEAPLAMDVFRPTAASQKALPVIVNIHGGLAIADRRISRPLCRFLAHRGYLVFSVEYRPVPQADAAQQLRDVCAGLDQVGAMLEGCDVDPDRVFLVAESAGAYLAAYAAAMRGSSRLRGAIGCAPGGPVFCAVGFNCGMFYTDRPDLCGLLLSDQLYGKKASDAAFRKYMDPENPEILNNLPPTYLTTSRGDFLNNYTMLLYKALKKANRPVHLYFSGDEDLTHAYITKQTLDPRVMEITDKMLDWFEEQAALSVQSRRELPAVEEKRRQLQRRVEAGELIDCKVWQAISDRITFDPRQMARTAVIDGGREITYREMFAQWQRYAAVFTALGITDENRSRVALGGTISAEPLFAFYALNRVGAQVSMFSYPDFVPGGRWEAMVRNERITDLILSDIMVTPAFLKELTQKKGSLGLRHILLLHSRLDSPCAGPAELIYNEFNYHALRRLPGAVYLDDLTDEAADGPIHEGAYDPTAPAVIVHTSGTTKGARKPLPFTENAINRVVISGREEYPENVRFAPAFDFSSFTCLNQMNGVLALGGSLVLTCFGFLHPRFIRVLEHYNVTMLFAANFMLDRWMEREDLEDLDLSSLRLLAVGGSYLPVERLKKYTEFAKAHHCDIPIFRGYGMSEIGGAQIIAPPGCEEDILGYPTEPENIRILDESDGKYYALHDGPRVGILHGTSDSVCLNTLDNEELFAYTVIEGRNYICTNDSVRVNEDGSLSYVGRADRYFVNNDGVRFDPDAVQVRLSAHPAVAVCAVIPVLEKRIHDTVPVLYVVPNQKGPDAPETIRAALKDVFLGKNALPSDDLPAQFILVDTIPVNANGKVDIYRITRDRLAGKAYNILPIREGETLTDVGVEPIKAADSVIAGTVPDSLSGSSAFDMYTFLNTPSESCFPFAKKTTQPDTEKKTLPQLSAGLLRLGGRLVGMLYSQKTYDYDFEA